MTAYPHQGSNVNPRGNKEDKSYAHTASLTHFTFRMPPADSGVYNVKNKRRRELRTDCLNQVGHQETQKVPMHMSRYRPVTSSSSFDLNSTILDSLTLRTWFEREKKVKRTPMYNKRPVTARAEKHAAWAMKERPRRTSKLNGLGATEQSSSRVVSVAWTAMGRMGE